MAITVSGVWKRYRLRSQTLKELLTDLLPRSRSAPPPRPKSMWALEDVSFEVKPSSTFALVGANGSGQIHHAQADRRHDETDAGVDPR